MAAGLRLYEDILNQPQSLAGVIARQTGVGRAALLEAAALICGARRVIFSGMGASLFASIPLEYYLASHGVAAAFVETGELLHYRAEQCRDAVVVLLSRSGNTVEVTKLLAILKDRGNLVVGVTNEADSTLALEADVTILVGSARDELVAIQTYTGTVAALLLLGAAVTGERVNLEGLLEPLATTIQRYAAESLEWQTFFEDTGVVYLLARGPSMASAIEGALLFNETAKLPTVPIAAGGFRHGPVEVVDARFRGFLFASQDATRDLDRQLASDITRFGGRVQLIHNDVASAILEIVPVQFAALRVAEWRDIALGRFRYVSAVTLSESSFA